MTSFTGTADDGSQVIYADKKRHLYWMILIAPAVSLTSIWLYFALGNNPIVTLIPALFFYAFTPLMDMIMGEDPHNPPEEVVNSMMADNYYRVTVHTMLSLYSWPLLYLSAPKTCHGGRLWRLS